MEFNYLVEKKRMCESMQDKCNDCGLFYLMDENDNSCSQVEWDYPLEATEIVRKWTEGHKEE